MEYFRSGLKSVLGAPPPGSQPTGAETVCTEIGLKHLLRVKINPTSSRWKGS